MGLSRQYTQNDLLDLEIKYRDNLEVMDLIQTVREWSHNNVTNWSPKKPLDAQGTLSPQKPKRKK